MQLLTSSQEVPLLVLHPARHPTPQGPHEVRLNPHMSCTAMACAKESVRPTTSATASMSINNEATQRVRNYYRQNSVQKTRDVHAYRTMSVCMSAKIRSRFVCASSSVQDSHSRGSVPHRSQSMSLPPSSARSVAVLRGL